MQRQALHAISIAVLLATAGCLGFLGGGGSASDQEALQLATDSREAMESVDTYRMTMNMSVYTDEGNSYEVQRSGVFDADAQQARLKLTANGTQTPAYLDGTTMYVNGSDGWTARQLAESDSWRDAVGLAQQRYLLQNATVTTSGTETVNGVETTVLHVDPRDGKLRQLLTRSTADELGNVSIEEASYDLYVAEDTHRPRKVDLTLQFTLDDEWSASGHGSATITFSAYNESVNVTIPEQARTESNGGAESRLGSRVA